MRRCTAHNKELPCFYCEKGKPSFENMEMRLAALEDRVYELENGSDTFVRLDRRNTNLVLRMGGLGDLAILTASLRALKEKEPLRPLVLATRPEHIMLLEGLSFLDGLIPIGAWGDLKFKHQYDLRYGVEPVGIGSGKLSWETYMTVDRSDLFDRLLGVESKKEFTLPVDEDIQETWLKRFEHVARPLIGVIPTCKSPVRVMPPEYTAPLAAQLKEKTGGTIVLLGKTESWNSHLAGITGKGIVNLIDKISVPEMVALISVLDLVISPDSSPVHIAAALKVNCLALFGNIPPETRITYYPTVKALYPKGELSCIPCGDKSGSCVMPKKTYGGHCMRLLTPDRIVREVEPMLKTIEFGRAIVRKAFGEVAA